MVQIIKAAERRPSFSQQLNTNLGRGLDRGIEMYEKHLQEKKQKGMLERLGLDPDILSAPKELQGAYFKQKLPEPETELQKAHADYYKAQTQGLGKKKEPTELEKAHADYYRAQTKNLGNPKTPIGGISGQPVPQEISSAIPQILHSNKDATADELAEAFDASGIPRAYSNSYIENRRRIDEAKAKAKTTIEQLQRTEQLAFHKESEKYDEKVRQDAIKADKQLNAIKASENAINSGNVNPSNISNIFRGLGGVGDKIANAYLNKDTAVLQASIPEFLEGMKEIFGVRLSDADLRVVMDKLPDMGKTPEANKAILNLMKRAADFSKLRYRIAKEEKSKNGNLRSLGFADQVERRFEEMTEPVKIIVPGTGNEIEIPAFELSDALESGARLVND